MWHQRQPSINPIGLEKGRGAIPRVVNILQRSFFCLLALILLCATIAVLVLSWRFLGMLYRQLA
jgi:hypothetical protein